MAIVFPLLCLFYFMFYFSLIHMYGDTLFPCSQLNRFFNEVDHYSHVFTSFAFIRIARKGGSVVQNAGMGGIQGMIVGTGMVE